MKNRLKIKWTIFTYFIVFVMIMILVLWLFQVVFLDTFYRTIKTNQIKVVADQISESLIAKKSIDLENISQDYEFNIQIITKDGLVLIESIFGGRQQPIPVESLKYIYTELNNHNQSAFITFENGITRFSHANNIQFISYAKVVDENLMVLIQATILPVNATVDTLKIQFIFIAVLLLFISVVITLFMSNKIAKPIEQINENAKELALGNYDVTFGDQGYVEIIELAKTLNHTKNELKKTEKYQQEIMANVSHDLKTPLTLISGYAEMIRDLPSENNQENIQVIIDESQYLSKLVDDIVALSFIQQSNYKSKFERIDFVEDIKIILQRFQKLTKSKGIEVKFDFPSESQYVNVDRLKLSQVIYNFVNNALNYSNINQLIEIKIINKKKYVRFEITNFGVGISKEDIDNVWKRYYKTELTHQRLNYGTGIGLSIVKNILNEHNALFGVESDGTQYTTFFFELLIS